MEKIKNFYYSLPVILAGFLMSGIQINGDGSFSLSSGDVSGPGQAIANLGESIFTAVIAYWQYAVGFVGVMLLIALGSRMFKH